MKMKNFKMKLPNLRPYLCKIYLLLWKNLILLKRQYIITACEIILPTLFILTVAYNNSQKKVRRDTLGRSIGRANSTFRQLSNNQQGEYGEQWARERLNDTLKTRDCDRHFDADIAIIGYVSKNAKALDILKTMVDDASQNSSCTNKTKVNLKQFVSEHHLETGYSAISPLKNPDDRSRQISVNLKFAFGIVFEELTDKTATYKIRLPDWSGKTNDLTPREYPESFEDTEYYRTSFTAIQLLLDKALIEHFTGKEPQYMTSFKEFPKPNNRDPVFEPETDEPIFTGKGNELNSSVSVKIILGFIFIVSTVVGGVVSEKETGIKELMKMSGLPEWMHWFGWMLNSLMVFSITVTIITILLFVRFENTSRAVFTYSDPFLFWIILMTCVIWATTYCFVIAAFFERPILASTLGYFIWIASWIGLGMCMDQLYGEDWSLGVKLIFCLFPNVGMYFTLKAFCYLEASEKGANWGTMLDTITEPDKMTLLYPFLMMFASIFLNMIICLYVEAVLPKKFGIRKPVYFMFLPSEWGCRCNRRSRSGVNKVGDESVLTSNEKPGFENEPEGIEAGVRIVNLRKTFGKHKVAVDDLSLNILKGQIFCLLGENGAGKTTTMSILTGLFSPTSGTAFINGLDIKTDMAKIRQSLGLCPQHNMLFDKMTVFEHLKFFGMLRGVSSKDANAEALYLLQALRFQEKKDALSKTLSGGQKRKLSLGCAIVGGSKILFLDEPTSGMDPEARRAIWEILLNIRHDRTIILSTHFMEEADVLGDRIGIMAAGKLQCCGSPNYLKRFYGAGLVLSMTIKDGADREKILSTVRNHIPDAAFKDSHSNNAAELSVVLPSENNTSSLFPGLFSELAKKETDLGIDEMGVGWTTMDDVFVRVEELSHGEQVEGNDNVENQNPMAGDVKPVKVRGLMLLVSQFYGLLMKNIIWTIRKRGLMIFQILILLLFTAGAVFSSRVLYSKNDVTNPMPPLKFSLSSYNDPVTLYSSIDSDIGNNYSATVGSSAKPISKTFNNNVYKALLDVAKTDDASYRERYIIAGEINGTIMKAMFSTVAQHSAPLSMNMMTNTMLRLAVGAEYKINIINHPLRNKIQDLLTPAIRRTIQYDRVVAVVFCSLLPTGFTLFVGSFIIAPIEERVCNAKQLQLITGVSPLLYWGSRFIWDFFLILIAICLMIACLPIFESVKAFTNNGGAGVLFLILVVHGISALSFTYVLSTFIRSTTGGFTLIIGIHYIIAQHAPWFADLEGIDIPDFPYSEIIKALAITITVIFNLFPSFGATKAVKKYADVSISNSRCSDLGFTDDAIKLLCSKSFDPTVVDKEFSRECCDNCGKLGYAENCFKPAATYITWVRERDFGPILSFTGPGIGQDLTWLVVIAVVYSAILLTIEYYSTIKIVLQRIFKQKAGGGFQRFQRTVTDDDVVEETNRIGDLVQQRRTNEEAITVHNFCKSYGNFRAVSMLSFGVHHGECFGLLGVNGAGKTTTFRMLTGDESRSCGDSYVQNLSLSNHKTQFLSKLGYCPQFDAFVGGHTGKEMLYLFARLRGVPFRCVKKETEKWLKRTGLSASGNVKCKKYSGGMKRRLNAAIAFIGDPQVILMDEPTSGVDPFARRQFWKIISSVKNSGQSIILTSHSMDECEALCSRVGIMVNGELQCFGGVQHLKSKFAQGYSLTIKLKHENYQNTEMTTKAGNEVLSIFYPCSLKDFHQTTMKFQIHSQERSWEDLYKTMEGIKENNQECIEEYAITETTLEEVFVSFARAQQGNAQVAKGGMWKCC